MKVRHCGSTNRDRTRRGWCRHAAGVWRGSPLALLVAAGLLLALGMGPLTEHVQAQSENLVNRISNKRMADFEERLTKALNAALSRYISPSRYVLAVKVVWNPDIVPVIEHPELGPEKQKLPGFPIFVRAPDSPAVDDGTPPFNRLEVKVLLDETLPEYYERFVRKLVPIVARFDFNRGDQVVVLKETFPALQKEQEPPTLPEKELMQQLGEALPPGQQPMPQPAFGAPPMGLQPQVQVSPFAQQATTTTPTEAAQMAYDEGRYTDALRVTQNAFQRATTNQERSHYLGMEGSIYYTMNNLSAARASWERALVFDPANLEIHKALNYLNTLKPSRKSQ